MKLPVFNLTFSLKPILLSSARRHVTFLLLFWCCLIAGTFAQEKQWDKTFGGSEEDVFSEVIPAPDDGYLLGGTSRSGIGGDKSEAPKEMCTPPNCAGDYWVVKTDGQGQKQWDRTIGGTKSQGQFAVGTGDDYLTALCLTPDGGYLLGGTSNSVISGDKSESKLGRPESVEYWVVKLDGQGNKIWDKAYNGDSGLRGSGSSLASIIATSDGGFLLGGSSSAGIGHDKTEANRSVCNPVAACYVDYWVIKIDAEGKKQWDKTLGGTQNDYLETIVAAPDGGYLLGGTSGSPIGADKSEANVGGCNSDGCRPDYWIVKIDSRGNKLWDKAFGGDGNDLLQAMVATSEGGFLLGGSSSSGISGDKTEASRGGTDYWVVKLDVNGQKQWDKTYGGHDIDRLLALQQIRDRGYVLGGYSNSGVSGEKSEPGRGFADYWVVKLDVAGNKQWDKTYGGSDADYLFSLQQTHDGGYLLGGYSNSGISSDKSEPSRGGSDYWVVKLTIEAPQLLSFSPTQGLPGTLVTLTGQHLLTTRAVLFNGFPASFEVLSDSEVRAFVPVHAISGNITVETAGGQATSHAAFTVLELEIAAFLPAQGRVGSRVFLFGSRLATAGAVYFNEVPSPSVTVYFDWVISAVVPPGASTGRIKVLLRDGGSGTSESDFIVLPDAASGVVTLALARKETPGGTTVPGIMEAAGIVAYPNPFRGQLSLSFTLAQPRPVVLKVYDMLGREVSLLYQGEARAGQAYQLEWRPPAQLPGGLYIIRLQAPGQVNQHKVLLVR